MARYRDHSKREHSKSFTTQKEAKAWIAEQQRSIRRGEWVDPQKYDLTVTQLIGEDSQRAASAKSGMAESTLSRQLSRGSLRPEMVIALCRGYGRSPVTGLIETGYLNEWEADGVGIQFALHRASNQ